MAESMDAKSFAEFRTLTLELTGISIGENRLSMVEGRVRRRMREVNLTDFQEYLKRVRGDVAEKDKFIDLITTNETYFFRTPRIWDYVEKKFLPSWYEKHRGLRPLRCWSAASSTGDEAHSLGLLCHQFKESHAGFSYQILGTDISAEMVERAKSGRYGGKSIEALRKTRPHLAEAFMTPVSDGEWQAHAEIRAHLQFRKHNLLQPLNPREPFDLILLRNVLIYFKPAEQEIVLKHAAKALAPEGRLIIGESESLGAFASLFGSEEPLVYRRTDGGAAA